MKPMSERKMDLKKGRVISAPFFPESAEHKELPKAGAIKGFTYPDTEEAIHRDQEQSIKATSKNLPKPNFRH